MSGNGNLLDEVASALGNYVEQGGEAELSVAYELGRRALVDGLGMLDIAAALGAARFRVVEASNRPRVEAEASCAQFVRELLSPFEMALMGFRESNRELRRLNEELIHQREAVVATNRELEAFSYSVSHDLRAPLRRLDGFSQALLEDCFEQLDDTGKKHIDRIRAAARQMDELVSDLLKLSRATRGELSRARVDLSGAARRIAHGLKAADPARAVSFEIEDGLSAFADPGFVGIVLENLLGNAWKFTGKVADAHIAVGRQQSASGAHASTERDETVFFVRDDGAGFDMANAARMFTVFHRLHAASDFQGTGIGLATVQRIINRHGGRIWAEARVGEGATFFFSFGPDPVP